jgi:adenylosuccinate synthase
MIDGVTKIALTKLDVLDGFDQIGICVGYDINGTITKEFPAAVSDLEAAKPVIEWMPGWKTNLTDVTSVDQLPENAKKYLARLAELLDAKIGIISVGPRRDQTFEVK